jgi:hypothetical protein
VSLRLDCEQSKVEFIAVRRDLQARCFSAANALRFPIYLLPALLALTGCGKDYQGNGEFRELSRTYVPVIGVNRGYLIEMPVFYTVEDWKATYSLKGLPRINDRFEVMLLTYVPTEPLSPEKQEEINDAIPAAHEVHCALVDSKTKAVFAETSDRVTSLSASHVEYQSIEPFLKDLLRESFSDIPAAADLEIRFEYRTNGVPLERNMLVIVLNEPPTA